MKRIALIILFLGMIITSFAQSRVEKTFDEFVLACRNRMYVSYVYVSEAMMKVVDAKDFLSQVKGINGNELINLLSSMQIVGVEDKNKRTLQNLVTGIVLSDNYEKLLRLQNDNSATELFFHKGKSNVLLMVYEDPKWYKVIVFSGKFTIQDIVNAMEKR